MYVLSGNCYYNRCRGGVGKPVEVRLHDGRIQRGIIDRVSSDRVYLRPLGKNYGGYGYAGRCRGGFCGGGWGWGFGAGIALGAIASLFFLPLFFW
ncbi:hypothetical protein [Cytobacillus horneckiae]|uniref:hypothetical protein n=1 Tax=Cytobacillus horneckiae TaxID=549687 RepID=UPI00398A7E33